jgi:predicted RNA polymerase sigma factor
MLQPNHAEALGLLAPMPCCEARRPAQIDEAERCLRPSAQHRQPGSFQLESAILLAHRQNTFALKALRSAVAYLYVLLVAIFPQHRGVHRSCHRSG